MSGGALVYEKAVQEDLDIGTGQVDVSNPGGGTIRGTRVNLGSLAFATYNADWTPGSVASGGIQSLVLSLPGVVVGDMVLASYASTLLAPLVILVAFVSAADAVTVSVNNATGAPVNPGTARLRVMVFKHNLT